jgi:hypothetical protein
MKCNECKCTVPESQEERAESNQESPNGRFLCDDCALDETDGQENPEQPVEEEHPLRRAGERAGLEPDTMDEDVKPMPRAGESNARLDEVCSECSRVISWDAHAEDCSQLSSEERNG